MNPDFIYGIDFSWSLFLDRDGVLNKKKQGGYIESPSEFQFLQGVPEAVAMLREVFGHIFVVTNQQGIGKMRMTETDLYRIHAYMEQQLSMPFDKIYYSPFLEEENNIMRKPNQGMAMAAKTDFPEIELSKSVMVGDSPSDILFGKNAGMKTVYITHTKNETKSDWICSSLYDFAQIMLHR
jgi:D-glycero-D-manno-heptose 1,7-bisphosphate phosphatase